MFAMSLPVNSSVIRLLAILCSLLVIGACTQSSDMETTPTATLTGGVTPNSTEASHIDIMKKPLITHIYTADPSAHVFEDRLYIYPSHDLDHDSPSTQDGEQFDMEDYHVFSLENMHSFPVDHGQVLHVDDVPWAEKQMWAPDAAFKNDTYYLYFPAKDYDGIFRIGVATSQSPAGPFTPQSEPIPGSFSIDPTVFVDEDGQAYIYFGGLWGGQLENGERDPSTSTAQDQIEQNQPWVPESPNCHQTC
jgi:hypothetical protein